MRLPLPPSDSISRLRGSALRTLDAVYAGDAPRGAGRQPPREKMLLEEGILAEDEKKGAGKVLSAAALTYVAALLTSLIYFLRFAVWVFALFGRRRD